MSSYATTADLYVLGIPKGALNGITVPQQQQALDAASDLADSYLGARFVLPLTSYGQDLRRAVCRLAAYDLLFARGFNPDDESNKLVAARAKQAEEWLEAIAKEEATPVVTDSSVGTAPDQGVPFTAQLQVVPAPGATPLTMSGPPPSIVTDQPAQLQVGTPVVRGW